jgi:hypothetical protein
MSFVEVFSIPLSGQPSDDLKLRLKRYLHMRNLHGSCANRAGSECVGQAWIDPHTSLQLRHEGNAWRLVCRSSKMSYVSPSSALTASHDFDDGLKRGPGGTAIASGQQLASAAYQEARVRQVLGSEAAAN